MKRTRHRIAGVALAAVFVIGVAGSARAVRMEAVSSTTAMSVVKQVVVGDNYYRPKTATISDGTTVKWINQGKKPHTVTSTTGLWDKRLKPGASYSRTFSKVGTFKYYCRIHTGQVGKIVVE